MAFATVTVSDKGQISIPKSMRDEMGIKDGERLVVRNENGRIVLEQVKRIEQKLALFERGESTATMLASEKTLSKDWDNDEDERWNNV